MIVRRAKIDAIAKASHPSVMSDGDGARTPNVRKTASVRSERTL